MKTLYIKYILGLIILFVFQANYAQWNQLGSAIVGQNVEDRIGASVSLSADGTIMAIGGPTNSTIATYAGLAMVYQLVDGDWEQMGNPIYGSNEYDNLGIVVSLSNDGSIIAIGSPNHGGTGAVSVYQYTGIDWEQLGDIILGENQNDYFGFSLKINSSGLKMIIGAPFNDDVESSAGKVYVYELNDNNWIQSGSSIYGNMGDNLGVNVDINAEGNIIAISAPLGNNSNLNSGYVKIFEYQNDNWVLKGNTIEGQNYEEQLGSSVSINSSGDMVSIGSKMEDQDNQGSVQAYHYNSGTWIPLGNTLNGSNAEDHFYFTSLNSAGDILVVGAYGSDNAGYVKTYQWDNDHWLQMGTTLTGENAGDWFSQVALDSLGTTLAVGASAYGANNALYGQVKVFTTTNVSVNAVESQTLHSVYPNPSSGRLTIENSGLIQQLSIYNISGSLVRNKVVNGHRLHLDLSDLKAGMYLLNIKTEHQVYTEKLMIER